MENENKLPEEIKGAPYIGTHSDQYVRPKEGYPECLIANYNSLSKSVLHFARMNDTEILPFSKIADYIEENL